MSDDAKYLDECLRLRGGVSPDPDDDRAIRNVLNELSAARAQVEALRDALMDAQTYLPVYAPDACHDCQHSSCMKRRTELDELHAKINRALAALEDTP